MQLLRNDTYLSYIFYGNGYTKLINLYILIENTFNIKI